MIKVDLYKLHTNNYFTGVKLDLLPTEIIIHVNDRTFSFFYSEIVYYKCEYNSLGEDSIIIKIRSPPKNLTIVLKPYKKEGYDIIVQHLNQYCNKSIVFTINPIFSM
jgi:hypothetical protein